MTTTTSLTTPRLLLAPLADSDAGLLYALVNTEGWLRFIGNRNVNNLTDAAAYIQTILSNQTTIYWTVTKKETNEPLGVVTLIQRTYLPYPDIGFAFLPEAWGRGYAYEATRALLDHLAGEKRTPQVFAVIVPTNAASIRLVEKLGLRFDKSVHVDNEDLYVYEMTLPA